ncbi:MAG: hypothetical protein OEZ29_05050 [Candidatus Bathyarchaeota archaeon]|nr:hypothetical protein [Candidatus Bathyarchaeota archaeon]
MLDIPSISAIVAAGGVLVGVVLAIHKTIHKPVPTQKSLNPAPFTELTQHTEAAVV